MRKLRVGVWLLDNYKPEQGGGFSYYSQMIQSLKDYDFKEAEILFVSNKVNVAFFSKQKVYEIQAKRHIPKIEFWKKVLRRVGRVLNFDFFEPDFVKIEERYFVDVKSELNHVIDVMYYLTPVVVFPNFPFIYTLWDIGHLSMYAFPEVSMNGIYERRQSDYNSYPQKALMVFCESKVGKADAENYLGINRNRTKVIPMFPSEIINSKIVSQRPKNTQSDVEFIHYPAQYWAHKNHYNLLLAFKEVQKKHPNLKLFLTGSDKGNKSYILSVIKELNLDKEVVDYGFVSNEELKWLYLNSMGLVMPTFLGPTNMPLLEAAALGCPVACSDLAGHKEQLGDYAYYFNPLLPDDIANAIITMLLDKNNNVKRHYNNTFTLEIAIESIDAVFTEMKQIRFCWGISDISY